MYSKLYTLTIDATEVERGRNLAALCIKARKAATELGRCAATVQEIVDPETKAKPFGFHYSPLPEGYAIIRDELVKL